MKTWKEIPLEKKLDLVRVLLMEAEGGGWIPDDLWEEDEAEAQAQADTIRAAVSFILVNTPGLREALHEGEHYASPEFSLKTVPGACPHGAPPGTWCEGCTEGFGGQDM